MKLSNKVINKLINKKISNKELIKMFDINYHTKRIDLIYRRIFKRKGKLKFWIYE